jgi:DNA-binding NtrC family response regulator
MKKVLMVIRCMEQSEKVYHICRKFGIEPEHSTSLAGGMLKLDDTDFDVVICHSDLDDGSGLGLITRVNIEDPKTRIIGLTYDNDMHSLMRKAGCAVVVDTRKIELDLPGHLAAQLKKT